MNDTLTLAAVTAPAGVTLLDDLEETVIATLTPPAPPSRVRGRDRGGDRARRRGAAPRRARGRRGRGRGRGRLRRRRRGVAARCGACFGARRPSTGWSSAWATRARATPARRHNVGFEVADALRARWDLPQGQGASSPALLTEGAHRPRRPARGAAAAADLHERRRPLGRPGARRAASVPLDRVLVVHDEIDLPFGEVRARLGGGLAGHNGLKSLKRELGSRDFARVRVGVGRPDSTDPEIVSAYVLGRFREPRERGRRASIDRAADAAERVVLGETATRRVDWMRDPAARPARSLRVPRCSARSSPTPQTIPPPSPSRATAGARSSPSRCAPTWSPRCVDADGRSAPAPALVVAGDDRERARPGGRPARVARAAAGALLSLARRRLRVAPRAAAAPRRPARRRARRAARRADGAGARRRRLRRRALREGPRPGAAPARLRAARRRAARPRRDRPATSSPPATSASTRSRTAASSRSAAACSTSTRRPRTAPCASTCSTTRSSRCAGSRRSRSARWARPRRSRSRPPPSSRRAPRAGRDRRARGRGRPPRHRRAAARRPASAPSSTSCPATPRSLLAAEEDVEPALARPLAGRHAPPSTTTTPTTSTSGPPTIARRRSTRARACASRRISRTSRIEFRAQAADTAARSLREAEPELEKLVRSGYRTVVTWPRRGEGERAAYNLGAPEGAVGWATRSRRRTAGLRFADAPRCATASSRPALKLAVIPEHRLLRRRRAERAERAAAGAARCARSPTCAPATSSCTRTTASRASPASRPRPSPASRATTSTSSTRATDKVFMPVDQLAKISRYVGAGGEHPPLSKLGGTRWETMKARARRAAQELAGELLNLYAERKRRARPRLRPGLRAGSATSRHAFPYQRDARPARRDRARSRPTWRRRARWTA